MIFGSRARGNYKRYSDIDFVIICTLDFDKLLNIENEIDDLLLPYKIDLSVITFITNTELPEHIERAGRIFYDRMRKMILSEPPV